MSLPLLLIVDDERTTREGLNAALEDHFDIYLAQDLKSAIRLVEEENFDVILTDLRMSGKEDGFDLIRRAKSRPHPPVCILMTAYGSEDVAVDAMKQGADDYISKGRMQIDELEMRIARALKHRKLEEENSTLHRQLSNRFGLENVVGESPAIHKILEIVNQVAPSKATVLLRGESGTGKEVIAKAIHQLSPRARAPMITTHCAALNANLLESELFGHEKGAFTGANERRIGRFEQANGGTLFLDEIGEIDASIQVKLLRFLGERTFERVGSNRTLTTDVRLIAATNKDLEKMVREGTFREDLFFRLRVVEIVIPPLRERVEDIPLMAAKFLREFSKENNKSVTALDRSTLELLQKYPWPGNVRELRACMEHAVIFSSGSSVQVRDLPPSIKNWQPETVMIGAPLMSPTDSHPAQTTTQTTKRGSNLSVKEAEKQLIFRALEECGGNRTAAALKLGISRRTLHRKLNEYQMQHL
ncbi:MAG: sigma-54-dependent Fis family transcriptional regulator [Verrucomicrobia bacterium]|nr:sigma-54-dependent Fis family transcriptional regulator [Verrucomicrobiota bacterium]MBR5977929.1 sigma-54-dependent Fis family transcriptional regulator [Verrucomicrobiota bacterium]